MHGSHLFAAEVKVKRTRNLYVRVKMYAEKQNNKQLRVRIGVNTHTVKSV